MIGLRFKQEENDASVSRANCAWRSNWQGRPPHTIASHHELVVHAHPDDMQGILEFSIGGICKIWKFANECSQIRDAMRAGTAPVVSVRK